MQFATLAGGCFWCLEPVFKALRGVHSVTSGYTGGTTENPDYREVCTGRTGHAEALRIEFDPAEISYAQLLDIFFAFHNPTTLNRQGADSGTQYRSAVFYASEAEKSEARAAIERIDSSGAWGDPAVTSLEPFSVFYPAEDYHQDYYRNNPGQPYCMAMIDPKLAKLRQKFSGLLKSES